MAKPHLVLLHPPSTYEYHSPERLYGLLASSIPSTALYEYFPLGFLSILNHLESHGFSARIVNLAVKSKRRSFDLEAFISSLDPLAFGVDFHWLISADGALKTCEVIKRYHPTTPVIVGGLSASYYHRELISSPHIDYVVRGDSTEEPLLQLLKCIDRKGDPSDIPNLTWKTGSEPVANRLSYLPDRLEGVLNYRKLLRSILKYRDLSGNLLTGVDWPTNFASMLLFCRGCALRCVTCGGSNWALKRKRPALKDPEIIGKELSIIEKFSPFYVALFGDIRQGDYDALLKTLKRRGIRNSVGFELFRGAGRGFLRKVSESCSRFQIRMSPETHDENIRKAFGKSYTNEGLEQTIEHALDYGAEKIWLFFMVGLPHQTRQSVRETLNYARSLLERYGREPKRIEVFISPLEPFIDPGSPAFEDPQKYGYRLLFRSLEEHRRAVLSSTWRDVLNYETEAMSREEIVDVSYEAIIRMEELRRDFGLDSRREAKKSIDRWTEEKLAIGSSVQSGQVC